MRNHSSFRSKQYAIFLLCFVASVTYAEENSPYENSGAKLIVSDHATKLINKEEQQRIQGFYFFTELTRRVEFLTLLQIDQNAGDHRNKGKMDELGWRNPTKALAILSLSQTLPVKAIPYLLKNIEYQSQTGGISLQGGTADAKYPTYPCVFVLNKYGAALIDPLVHFLNKTPAEFVTDKQIELMSYILHQRYGSGQAVIRIVTVLAEESTKQPQNENIVRLINHVSNTYKP